VLEPDGQKSHWLKVDRKLSEAAGAVAGDTVTLEIAPAAEEPEPTVPADLQSALATAEPESAGGVGGHHTCRAARLDPVDHLREASLRRARGA
jgi:hypothetical protein